MRSFDIAFADNLNKQLNKQAVSRVDRDLRRRDAMWGHNIEIIYGRTQIFSTLLGKAQIQKLHVIAMTW